MKAKAKSIFKPMKDALMLSKAQERMRRKDGDAIKKASPPFYSSAECVEQEQHFTPAQIAKQWGVSVYTVRRLFADVPGVLKIGQKGRHVSLRVPGRLLKAYHAKMSACRYRTSSSSTFKKSRTKLTRFVRSPPPLPLLILSWICLAESAFLPLLHP